MTLRYNPLQCLIYLANYCHSKPECCPHYPQLGLHVGCVGFSKIELLETIGTGFCSPDVLRCTDNSTKGKDEGNGRLIMSGRDARVYKITNRVPVHIYKITP